MTWSWRSPTCVRGRAQLLILFLISQIAFAAPPRLEAGAPWYEVLGFTLEEVRATSPQEITRAFQRLSLKYHPGQQVDNSPAEQAKAKDYMHYVTTAWHQEGGGKQFIAWPEEARQKYKPYVSPTETKLQGSAAVAAELRAKRSRGATPAQVIKTLSDRYGGYVVMENQSHGARADEVLALWEVLSPILSPARIGEEVESPAEKLELAKQITRFKVYQPAEIPEPEVRHAWEELHAWATWGYERVLEMARDGEANVTKEQVIAAYLGRYKHARQTPNPEVLKAFILKLTGLGEKAFAKATGPGKESFLETLVRVGAQDLLTDATKAKVVVDQIRNLDSPERSRRLLGEMVKGLSASLREIDYPDLHRRKFVRKDANLLRELAHDVALELMYNPPPGSSQEKLRALAVSSSPDQSYEGLRKFLGLEALEQNTPARKVEAEVALEKMMTSTEAREELLNHPDRARRLIRVVDKDLPESTGAEATRKMKILRALAQHYGSAYLQEVAEKKYQPTEYNAVLRSNGYLHKTVNEQIARVEPIEKQLVGTFTTTVMKWLRGGTACLLVFAASAQ